MNLAPYIDHTLLRNTATTRDIHKICEEAMHFNFKSVCISPVHVSLAAQLLRNSTVKVCTVIGFPLGTHTTGIKLKEAEQALGSGATELDMVINPGWLKEGRLELLAEEIRALRKLGPDYTLKVILETCLLTPDEIVLATQLCMEEAADFVKTSTGFSSGGASMEAVSLMVETARGLIAVKASGGISTREQALQYIELGAQRIGTSRGIALMEEGDTPLPDNNLIY